MSETPTRKYQRIEDLPINDGKPYIDENNLHDYSDTVLKKAILEIDKCLKSKPGIFGYPGVFADVEGLESWRKQVDKETGYLKEVKKEIEKEMFWRKQKR